jgi:hypothetical protein
MEFTLEDILKNSELKIVDVQRAGCVVFHIPAEFNGEVASQFIGKLKGWAEQLGVNILILPKEVQISAIPREAVSESQIHSRVDALEKQVDAIINNLSNEGETSEEEDPIVVVKS